MASIGMPRYGTGVQRAIRNKHQKYLVPD